MGDPTTWEKFLTPDEIFSVGILKSATYFSPQILWKLKFDSWAYLCFLRFILSWDYRIMSFFSTNFMKIKFDSWPYCSINPRGVKLIFYKLSCWQTFDVLRLVLREVWLYGLSLLLLGGEHWSQLVHMTWTQ